MATLAAAFLEDFDGQDSDEGSVAAPPGAAPEAPRHAPGRGGGDGGDSGDGGKGDGDGQGDGGVSAGEKGAAVAGAPRNEWLERRRSALDRVRAAAAAAATTPAAGGDRPGVTEEAEMYSLVVLANSLCVELDQEVTEAFQLVTELFSKRFPELSSHVPDPLTYLEAVRIIGNETEVAALDLGAVLTPAQAMAVSMTGAELKTPLLPQDVLARVERACATALELKALKEDLLLPFVARQMPRIAPNVNAILGSDVTAQLLAVVGGLGKLVKIPACNVQVIGKGLKALHGFARAAAMRHFGLIHGCQLVQDCAPEHRVKAMRVVAGRVALAARLDAARSDRAGTAGSGWATEIRGKLTKWHAPPPGKTKRALPVPVTEAKKRRGGKRARRLKELYGVTEVAKQANRVQFGVGDDEYGDAAMGNSLGMLGKDGGGNLRVTAKEQRRLRQQTKLKGGRRAEPASNSTHRRLGIVNSLSGGVTALPGSETQAPGAATSGTASSIAFTPVQGFELRNPAAAAAPDERRRKVEEANRKLFGEISFSKRRKQ